MDRGFTGRHLPGREEAFGWQAKIHRLAIAQDCHSGAALGEVGAGGIDVALMAQGEVTDNHGFFRFQNGDGLGFIGGDGNDAEQGDTNAEMGDGRRPDGALDAAQAAQAGAESGLFEVGALGDFGK